MTLSLFGFSDVVSLLLLLQKSSEEQEEEQPPPPSPPQEDQQAGASKPEEEAIDIDLNDPAVEDAAIKIQAQFKGFMVRKEKQKHESQ